MGFFSFLPQVAGNTLATVATGMGSLLNFTVQAPFRLINGIARPLTGAKTPVPAPFDRPQIAAPSGPTALVGSASPISRISTGVFPIFSSIQSGAGNLISRILGRPNVVIQGINPNAPIKTIPGTGVLGGITSVIDRIRGRVAQATPAATEAAYDGGFFGRLGQIFTNTIEGAAELGGQILSQRILGSRSDPQVPPGFPQTQTQLPSTQDPTLITSTRKGPGGGFFESFSFPPVFEALFPGREIKRGNDPSIGPTTEITHLVERETIIERGGGIPAWVWALLAVISLAGIFAGRGRRK